MDTSLRKWSRIPKPTHEAETAVPRVGADGHRKRWHCSRCLAVGNEIWQGQGTFLTDIQYDAQLLTLGDGFSTTTRVISASLCYMFGVASVAGAISRGPCLC